MSEEEVIFKSWFQAKLSDLLGFPTGEEMVNYILAFESAREIKEHFSGLLDPADPSTKRFLDEFFAKWKPRAQNGQIYKKVEVVERKTESPSVRKKTNQKARNSPVQSIFKDERNGNISNNYNNSNSNNYNSSNNNNNNNNNMNNNSNNSSNRNSPQSIFVDERQNNNGGAKPKNPPTSMRVAEKGSQPNKILNTLFPEDNKIEVENNAAGTPIKMVVDTRGAEFLDKNALMPCEKKSGSPFKGKNLKYVPLFSKDGKVKTDIVQLEGRHPCKCLAQKHKLINNCEQCGRIVCEQEGAGPCMFCQNLVCSREDQEILDRDSKKSKKLHEKLMSQTYEEEKVDASLQKAIAHKERLLEFDKNCTKRTKVLDDEADYFSDNTWLTKKDREKLSKREVELRDKRHVSRLEQKFTLDFAGRKIVEEVNTTDLYDPEDHVVQGIFNPGTQTNPNPELNLMCGEHPLLDPRLKVPAPVYDHSGDGSSVTESLKAQHAYIKGCVEKKPPRVQDPALQQITDPGMCLSMHQPWASLLVYGIKKLEGRSWYTPHRGRLWIASTAKTPDEDQIRFVEEQYRHLYPDENVEFPPNYPSGALLGCVNVVDCATNEEYFAKNPNVQEENDSAYLFVCDNANQLDIKFAMKGQHKTYKLDKHIHDAAKKNLLSGRNM